MRMDDKSIKDHYTFNTKEIKEISKNSKINVKVLTKLNNDYYKQMIIQNYQSTSIA